MVAISDKEVEAEAEGVVVAADAVEGDICPMPAAGGVAAAAVVAIVPVAAVGSVC